MTKDEMAVGFSQGRRLIQEEWSAPDEIKAVDECIADGKCAVEDDWRYHDNFQCERRIVVGVKP